MNYTIPKDGKVVIVDNCYNEILPLIKILNKENVPVLYYSGIKEEMPENPLNGIRLVFLDLRYNTTTDEKSIVSNAYAILKSLIAEQNGPYILFVWTSTGNDHEKALLEMLEKVNFKPERVQFLSKADYFERSESDVVQFVSNLTEMGLAEKDLEMIIDKAYTDYNETSYKFRECDLENLRSTIIDNLEVASLLALFIEWENKSRETVSGIVNQIYSMFPSDMEANDKLAAMVDFFAQSSMGDAEYIEANENAKIMATVEQMNELLEFFLDEKRAEFKEFTITQKNVKSIPFPIERFNTWKMTRWSERMDTPGKIYVDDEKLFKWDKLIKQEKNKERKQDIAARNAEKIESTIAELHKDSEVINVLLNINGECEVAQKKYPVIRVIPGVLISAEKMNKYIEEGKIDKMILSKSIPDDYYNGLKMFEFKGKSYCLVFNIEQQTYLENTYLSKLSPIMELSRKYYMMVRSAIALNIQKQGSDLYL